MRFITPIILILVAIALFFLFTSPLYDEVSLLKAEVASYNDALSNSKALESERDKLTQTYNSIDVENLSKLEKLLPENVDNIRLILEIGQIAAPYGMVLKDVKYNVADKETSSTGAAKAAVAANSPKDYGIFDLEFSTSGTYDNFINFTRDLESNLRIVDISSVTFTSDMPTGGGVQKTNPEVYKYDFKIKTYWLKN